MINKLINDGKVAVIHSCDYGGGWSTSGWNTILNSEHMMFDPSLASLILANASQAEIEKHIREEYIGDQEWFMMPELTVTWVDQGEEFVIADYDGLETVELKKDFNWITA